MHGIEHQIASLIEHFGLPALFVSIVLETFGLPSPAEVGIIATSAAAADGKFNVYHVAMAAMAAGIVGDNLGYLIGRRYGEAAILTYGPRIGVSKAAYERVRGIEDRYGAIVVIGARFFVIARQLNGLLAGSTQMRWPIFFPASICASLFWAGLWSTVGYFFGAEAVKMPQIWHHLSWVAAIVLPLLIIVLFVLYRRAKAMGLLVTSDD